MRKFSKVALFDIDYTLFDSKKYREKIFKNLSDKLGYKDSEFFLKKIEETYYSSKEKGSFIPAQFVNRLVKDFDLSCSVKELEDILWRKEIFVECLYKEAEDVLRLLSKNKNIKIGIFSGGHDIFQRRKIEAVKDFFDEEHIHVFMQKGQELKKIIGKYKGKKLYYIDDILELLEKAKKINEEITTIWIKRGRFAKKQAIADFHPDKTITNLIELVPVLKNN